MHFQRFTLTKVLSRNKFLGLEKGNVYKVSVYDDIERRFYYDKETALNSSSIHGFMCLCNRCFVNNYAYYAIPLFVINLKFVSDSM